MFAFWNRYKHYPLGVMALIIVLLFILIGIYAPFLASSKPLMVIWDGTYYFPLFRYLFFLGFYTKPLDIFFNLFIFTLPLFIILTLLFKNGVKKVFILVLSLHLTTFISLMFYPIKDPSFSKKLLRFKIEGQESNSWHNELLSMNDYAKLMSVMSTYLEKEREKTLLKYISPNEKTTLLPEKFSGNKEKTAWIEENVEKITFVIMPLLRPYHWEDDTLGSANLNRKLPFFERTRINHKDLTAALIFGVRISLVVGVLSVLLSLAIGIPLGAFAGYYAGKIDLLLSRVLEIWEAMPTFFMLLLTVAVTRSKSIFIIIGVLGFFGWTGIARFLRGEMLKQRSLPYAEACHSMGFKNNYIIFSHLLPNAIAPVLTLLPFAIMAAITSEAALSFLGLGEEGSSSWGVLMDEGRSAFPAESYLLWPPAILLTILLISIAVIGDTLRDALDPKLKA
jgi:peptide/nickel transport system permease protein